MEQAGGAGIFRPADRSNLNMMPVIICPECQGSISPQARACPHCGHPQTSDDIAPTANARLLEWARRHPQTSDDIAPPENDDLSPLPEARKMRDKKKKEAEEEEDGCGDFIRKAHIPAPSFFDRRADLPGSPGRSGWVMQIVFIDSNAEPGDLHVSSTARTGSYTSHCSQSLWRP